MEANGIVESMEADRVDLCSSVQGLIVSGGADRAVAVAKKAIKQYRSSGYKKGEATAHLMKLLATANATQSEHENTLNVAASALTAIRQLGERRTELEVLRLVTSVNIEMGDFQAAAATAKEMVSLAGDLGDDSEVADANLIVSKVCVKGGAPEEGLQHAKQSMKLYQAAGDKSGEARCQLLLADYYALDSSSPDVMDAAHKAARLAEEVQDPKLAAEALHREALAHLLNGSSIDALRSADKASAVAGSTKNVECEVDILIAQAEAKMNIAEGQTVPATWASIVQHSAAALAFAQKKRKHDDVCIGNALYTHARVLLQTNSGNAAWSAANGAVKAFTKVGRSSRVAQSLVLVAKASFRRDAIQEARADAMKALKAVEAAGDTGAQNEVFALLDEIHAMLGIPTRAELAEQERQLQQQQLQWQQQQQMLMMGNQQMQMMPLPIQQMPQQDAGPQQATSVARGPREASPLDLSAGMDPDVVKNKILTLAGSIIGDVEDLEADTPLMEAGLTSNSAVILRDELSKDLPGISLPPTLIFDYPSIAGMTDFILEKAKAKAIK